MKPGSVTSNADIDLTFTLGMPRLDRRKTRATYLLQQFIEGGAQCCLTTNELHDGGLACKCDALLVAYG